MLWTFEPENYFDITGICKISVYHITWPIYVSWASVYTMGCYEMPQKAWKFFTSKLYYHIKEITMFKLLENIFCKVPYLQQTIYMVEIFWSRGWSTRLKNRRFRVQTFPWHLCAFAKHFIGIAAPYPWERWGPDSLPLNSPVCHRKRGRGRLPLKWRWCTHTACVMDISDQGCLCLTSSIQYDEILSIIYIILTIR